MNGDERMIRFCASLMPAVSRDRYCEEWLADARDAHELAMSPSIVVRGAARTMLNAQKEALLMSSTFSPRQLTGRGLVAVVASATLFVSGILIHFPEGALVLWALAAVIAAVGFALFARAASSVLGNGRVPWTLFAFAAACPVILVAAVVEVNLHFNAQDAGMTDLDSGVFVAMLATGLAGVSAVAAAVVLSIVLAVKLVRAHTAPGPRRAATA